MSADLTFTGERFVPAAPARSRTSTGIATRSRAASSPARACSTPPAAKATAPRCSADVAAEVIGVDIAPDAVAHARADLRRRRGLRFDTASATALPLADAAFDAVVSFETHRAPAAGADQPRMLAEFARVLAPDGVLVISSPESGRVFATRATTAIRSTATSSTATSSTRCSPRVSGPPLVPPAPLCSGRRCGPSTATTEACETLCGDAQRRGDRGAAAGDVLRRRRRRASAAGAARRGAAAVALRRSRRGELRRLRRAGGRGAAARRAAAGARRRARPAVRARRHLEALVAERERIVAERDAQIVEQVAARRSRAQRALDAAARERDAARARGRRRAARPRRRAGRRSHRSGEAAAHARRRGRARLERALAAQERIIAYRQSVRWWLAAVAARCGCSGNGVTGAVTGDAATDVIDVVVPVYNAPDDVARCVDERARAPAPGRAPRADRRCVARSGVSPRYFARAGGAGACRRSCSCATRPTSASPARPTAACSCRAPTSSCSTPTPSSPAAGSTRIVRCARPIRAIGTITPFSNNAEICSFPRFCEDNPWPADADPEPIARGARERGRARRIPTCRPASGFCMYVRRALLDDVGIFDTAFGKGYGEENDFCLRAARGRLSQRARATTRSSCIPAGARSRAEKSRARRAQHGAAARAPSALPRHGARLHRRRSAAAAARRAAHAPARPPQRPVRGVLHVIHGHGGGTETHVRALIAASRDRWRHYLAIAVGDRWQVEEHRDDGAVRTVRLRRAATHESWQDFVGGLCATLRHRARPPAQHLRLPRRHPATRSPARRCPTATPCTTSISRARRSRSSAPTACTAARRPTPRSARAASRRSPRSTATDIVAWRERHRALLRAPRSASRRRNGPRRRCAATFPSGPVDVIAHGAPERRAACRAQPGVAHACVMLPRRRRARRSPCWARSAPTRARAASSAWSELARAARARRCASC